MDPLPLQANRFPAHSQFSGCLCLRTTTEGTASRWVPGVFVAYMYRWQINFSSYLTGEVQGVDCSVWWELLERWWCCPAAFLVLLSNIRADVGGLNKSTANLTALAQPPSDCALKAAQEGVPPSLVSEEKRSRSRTRSLSPTQQLTRQEHEWKPESLPGCRGAEVLRTLLAQSGHFLSIRTSGSGLCYPSVRKATEQLSINYFWEGCRLSRLGQGCCGSVCAPWSSAAPVQSAQLCQPGTAQGAAVLLFA